MPEALARANRDLLNDTRSRNAFLQAYKSGKETASLYLASRADELNYEMDEKELEHRMMRYGLNLVARLLVQTSIVILLRFIST